MRLLEWIGHTALLIYREKHWTFAYSFGEVWPPKFEKIEDDWLIHDGQLAYIGYKQEVVRRLGVPNLDEQPSLLFEEAVKQDLMPETSWFGER